MKFKSNTYHIIASIEDEKCIKGIYEDTIKRWCSEKGFECYYYSLENKSNFFDTIEQIKIFTSDLDKYPHIHVECHGSHNGIELKNGDKIIWEEIEEIFKEINGMCRNNLVVTMASCFGGHFSLSLLNNIRFEEHCRAPFFALIGPEKPISYGELEDGYSGFFDAFLTQRDLGTAVDVLTNNSQYAGKFIFMTCESIFKSFIEYFIENSINKTYKYEHKLDERVSIIIKDFETNSGKKATFNQIEQIKRIILNPGFNEQFLKKLMYQYYWLDVFPENLSRFDDLKITGNYT